MAETLSDEHVLLLEKTLQKNNEMIAENQKLREEMKAKEENHNKVLREVLNELQSIRQKQDNGNRVLPQRQWKTSKVQVPSACRVSIPMCVSHLLKFWFNRSHYLSLFEANWKESAGTIEIASRSDREKISLIDIKNSSFIYLCLQRKDTFLKCDLFSAFSTILLKGKSFCLWGGGGGVLDLCSGMGERSCWVFETLTMFWNTQFLKYIHRLGQHPLTLKRLKFSLCNWIRTWYFLLT